MTTGAIVMGCVGLLVGMGIMIWIVFIVARRWMVVEHESRYGFEETAERMKKTVEEAGGWVFPIPEWHFSDAMVKHGKPFGSVDRLIVFFLCKAEYAQQMVNTQRPMASIMPCGWALYEKDGKTYIGSMNIPLMAIPFKGTVHKMFTLVGKEETEMLDKILH